MSRIIDFHTHAFPDAIANRAISTLEAEAEGVHAFHDGRVSSLLASMDSAAINSCVICSIATRPAQFEPILKWSHEIKCERIEPFVSLHPKDPNWAEHITRIKAEGFKGVKFHPFYQDFHVAEPMLYPIYERLGMEDLMIVMHTGYDIAFERIRRADPKGILKVCTDMPGLKFISTHLGAWQMWDEVRRDLIGREIYMELSFALDLLSPDVARAMLMEHPPEFLLFGSDSPWTDQGRTLKLLRALELPQDVQRKILFDNAQRLLS